ncbi:MBL fold metallo-hydrolase [Phaeobacter gallaeciensis]|uniref:MBL fold metallo-hydrolase n=1 Tax=Phaeobacter TaxID=302485 RepID=UPI00237FD6F8|nr:MBL fold metallo-hydrolase [Phaeobacter gallaeciensis]MDE4274501.1 MBL fold metallo-hydrolase [Phaeobacter gallaeciensis]MDE4299924.1 MBL fold metallo-hydrolase [Phaeobacter gallaeciensis]MDE5185089.1 MBL fold metallo-hydrolase [Phaeobacter gallaeciensis]
MTITRRTLLKAAAVAPAAAAAPALITPAAAAPQGPTPVLNQFTLGDARITALLDGHLAIKPEFFTGYDAAKAEAALAGSLYRENAKGLEIPVNGYLVEQGGEYTLIDTGSAQLMGPDLGALPAALAAAGVTPEQIATVLLTHIHPDHCGGLLTPDGRAAFANAELAVAAAEWDYWHDEAVLAAVPEESRGFFQTARNSVAPYVDRLKLLRGEAEAASGLSAVPLPGHTPGHTGFMLDAGSEALLFWGDVVHSAALQFAEPDWTIPFDVDQALAAQTRRQMFDRAAADDLLVVGMHLDFPGLGKVKRSGEDFRFHQAPWQFGL